MALTCTPEGIEALGERLRSSLLGRRRIHEKSGDRQHGKCNRDPQPTQNAADPGFHSPCSSGFASSAASAGRVSTPDRSMDRLLDVLSDAPKPGTGVGEAIASDGRGRFRCRGRRPINGTAQAPENDAATDGPES